MGDPVQDEKTGTEWADRSETGGNCSPHATNTVDLGKSQSDKIAMVGMTGISIFRKDFKKILL
jgi:hypothetical protein